MAIYHHRKNGKLTGRLRIEVQSGGRRLRASAHSMADAKRIEKELQDRLDSGDFSSPKAPKNPAASPAAITVGEAELKAKGLLWSGQSTELESLRKLSRIVSIVGPDLSLDAFDSNTVDTVVKSLKDGGASDATVNRYLSAISAFLTFCKKRGFRTTAVPEMDWRDEDEGRIRWLSYEEEAAILDILPEPFSSIVYIAIRTGLRASELLTLKFDQVEPKWVHLWKTKNGGSRSVPITNELYHRIMDLIPVMPTYPQLRHQWDAARKAMGLSDDGTFVFHACRHTYATRAVQANVNPRILQKLMGHKTIQTTLRYSHVDDNTLSEAALGALQFHDARGGAGGVIAA